MLDNFRCKEFIPEKIIKYLKNRGWNCECDNFEPDKIVFGKKGVGMQKWVLISEFGIMNMLYIHYDSEGHYVNLYQGENELDGEVFKLRNLVSVLKSRGL